MVTEREARMQKLGREEWLENQLLFADDSASLVVEFQGETKEAGFRRICKKEETLLFIRVLHYEVYCLEGRSVS